MELSKKIIAVVLSMLFLISAMIVPASAAGDTSQEVALEIINDSEFSWGDTVTFDITIKNNKESRIVNVDIVSEAKGMSKYLQETEDSAKPIEYITPGATRTVQVIYSSQSISGFKAFFRAIVSFFKQIFIGFSRSYTYVKTIKIENSIIRFGIDVDYEISNQVNSGNVNLDDPDPDVEIYSFNTDTYDVLIGETKKVTFTSEIFTNIELEDDAVKVVDSENQTIGTMNDDGVSGDIESNDGIYTLAIDLKSDIADTKSYRAIANGINSNDVTISFYKHFNEAELNQLTQVINEINQIASKYTDDSGYLISGKLNAAMEELSGKMNQLTSSGIVSEYTIDGNTLDVKLVNGTSYQYVLSESGTDSISSITSVQPFKQHATRPYNDYLQGLSDRATDGSARNVDSTFETITFNSRTTDNSLNTSNDSNYDRTEVSLDAMKTIVNADTFAWHGHGGYFDGVGSVMCTGEAYSEATYSRYEADINAKRIVTSSSGFCISGGFVQKYAGDLSGHFLYLGTCSSAHDMEDGNTSTAWELAKEFNNKGAIVIGNTRTITTEYNTKMEASVFDYLCQTDSNGNYHTLSEALEYAKGLHGNHDPINHGEGFARVKIYPETTRAYNFRLLNTDQGTVAGVIKNASNSSAISNALIRIYKDDEIIAYTRTNSSGNYNISLPSGNYILKVSAGGYKTAKMAVTVRTGATTYNETFLLIFSGLNSGYANGNTINAITGQLLTNVRINIRNSWNNYEGEIVKTIESNGNGYYEVDLPAGLYTFECYKDGFITTYKNILVFVYDFDAQNISIAPELEEGYYRVVLTWGENPSDLDSHLFGTTSDYSYHVYYRNKNGYGLNDVIVANLDVDDTTSYGPETTTFYATNDGEYDFYVDWYSGSGTWSSSSAKVEVYNGAYLINTYYVPSVDNRSGSWKVFSIKNGIYTDYNTISGDIY